MSTLHRVQPSSEAPSITVAQLHQAISQPNDLFILDVRNEDEFQAWRIEGKHTPPTLNIPYRFFTEDQDAALAQAPNVDHLVVVCAIGAASDMVVLMLEEQGRQAVNLQSGMAAWGNFYATRPVVKSAGFGIYQMDRVARGCLSYVLVSDGKAAIIDPLRHTDYYKDFLVQHKADLTLLLDTHAHADHISGGPALAAATGAPYHLHPYDGIHPFDILPAAIPYRMLEDGQRFVLGQLQIEVIHTPGHTLGQVNFLVTAPDGSCFLFTGDNLFIESFGRPDLGGQGSRWAALVYDTIFVRVRQRVPAQALVLPGHYARAGEAEPNGVFGKSLARLWGENDSLQHNQKQEFIAYTLSHLPVLPPQYIEIKRINIGLSAPDEKIVTELELGKNICALSDAYF